VAEETFPLDDTPAATELQWSRLTRMFAVDGVDATPASNALRVNPTSGLNVGVAVGNAVLRGFIYRNTAVKSIGLATNTSTNPRIDRIVVRIDTTTNTGTAMAIQGTAAATPAAPAMTYSETIFDLPLALCRVEANDTISTVTDVRAFNDRGVVPCTSGNRPDPRGRAMVAVETDTNNVIFTTGDGSWHIGLGDTTYRTRFAWSYDQGDTSASTWDSTLNNTATPLVTLTFTTPPSGDVLIRISAYISNTEANRLSRMGVRIDTAGGAVAVGDGNISINHTTAAVGGGDDGSSCSGEKVFALDPNTSYTAVVRYITSGGLAKFDNRTISIQPLP
jgi:hypothetical protein